MTNDTGPGGGTFALEIENLNIHAHTTGKTLVDGVSLALRRGEILALVGESGCGKTMTVSAVMGLLPPGVHKASGNIRILGENTAEWSSEQYRNIRNERVSIVMQNPMSAFDPVLTIFSHFSETMVSHGYDGKKSRSTAMEALREMGFGEPSVILDLYPFQMSGGMLQRVMLAIALLSHPPVIIADEATTDLDLVSQKRILILLKDYSKKNDCALLLITHDFGVAASLAQKIILMKEGKIVESGEVKDFFDNPKSDYARNLLFSHRALYTERFRRIKEVIEA
ncbi:MAG: ABC transporter ATP-binding protein [Treponema sp.]|jgi:nickel transport system ATP-binding protein|nr:ABC transporter ATP-binding protein [Treponema sp.]